MHGLSYGVVRVDNENSLTSLTLQDCGQVMPGGVRRIVFDVPKSYFSTGHIGVVFA